jgi:hypothetical protein
MSSGPVGGPAAWRSAELSGREDFPLPRLGPRLKALRRDLLDGRGFAYLRGLPAERFERGSLRGGIHVPGLVRTLPLDAQTPAYR